MVGGGVFLPATAETISWPDRRRTPGTRRALDDLVRHARCRPLPFIPAERVGELAIMVLGVADRRPRRRPGRPGRPSGPWPSRSPTSSDRCPTRRSTASPRGRGAPGGQSIRSWFSRRHRCRRRAGHRRLDGHGTGPHGHGPAPRPGRGDGPRRTRGHRVRPARCEVLVAPMALFDGTADPAGPDAWTDAVYEAFADPGSAGCT